jgi:Short C-terminal domain
MFGRMKDPVHGTARLVSYEETNARNEFDTTIQAQVVVEGEGVPATAVESYIGVPNSQLPLDPGTTWNVVFERSNPKHFKAVEPDKATQQADHAAAQQQAEALAAQMRAGNAPGFGAGAGGPQVIDLSGGAADPERVAAAMAQVQQMFGVDMSGAAAAQAAYAPPAAAAPAASADDRLAQLERLAELHKSGTLNDAEFEAEKQKILASP